MYPVDLIIFDLDGTLIDSKEDLAASTNHALHRLGLPQLSVETIATYVGDGIYKLMERAIPSASLRAGPSAEPVVSAVEPLRAGGQAHLELLEEAVELFRNYYSQHLLDRTHLYLGVRETLEHFQEKKKAIVSNKPYDFTMTIVEGLGIDHYFDLILGGDSTENRKPHPEPVEKVLKQLGIMKERAAIVGDSPMDIEMGRKAGLFSVAVTYGLRPREELIETKPDLLIDDLYDLTKYLC